MQISSVIDIFFYLLILFSDVFTMGLNMIPLI